jgi:hypothetical protein
MASSRSLSPVSGSRHHIPSLASSPEFVAGPRSTHSRWPHDSHIGKPARHRSRVLKPAAGRRITSSRNPDGLAGDLNYGCRVPPLLTQMAGFIASSGATPVAADSAAAMLHPELLALPLAIHGGGGMVEATLAIKALKDSIRELSGKAAQEARLRDLRQELVEACREHQAVASPLDGSSRRLVSAMKHYWPVRQSTVKTSAALEQLAARFMDAFRYTVVAWSVRVVSIIRVAQQGAGWVLQVSAVLGIAGAALQAVAGMIKWHAARRMVQRAQRALSRLESLPEPRAAMASSSLEHRLRRHARMARCEALRKAKARRFRARVETAAGLSTLICLALGIAFPPLAIVAFQIMLLYALYRVAEGFHAWYLHRHGEHPEDNATPALHSAVEELAKGDVPWLRRLLAACGNEAAEIEAVFAMAATGEATMASDMLDKLLTEPAGK